MKTMKKLTVLCLLAIFMIGMIACTSQDTITLTVDKTTAKPGEVVTLSAKLNNADTTDVTYEITRGTAYATITDNKLTINADAVDKAEIKVVAKRGSATSEAKTVIVNVPLNSIEISAGGTTNVMPGNSVVLQKKLNPETSTKEVTWVVTEGEALCNISGDVLVVNANAKIGSLIKVKATAGEIESNVLTFIVGNPITSIKISASATNVAAGNSVVLQKTVNPENSTEKITWVITKGDTLCAISGDVLVVNADAATGSVIKVKATAGDSVQSN